VRPGGQIAQAGGAGAGRSGRHALGPVDDGAAAARGRLARRGFAGGILAATATDAAHAGLLHAAVPANLLRTTTQAAAAFAAGQTLCSSQVASLTHGVLKIMFLNKLRLIAATFLVVGAILIGTFVRAWPTPVAEDTARRAAPSETHVADKPAKDALRKALHAPDWILGEVHAANRTINVFYDSPGAFTGNPADRRQWLIWYGSTPITLDHLVVQPDAEVVIDGKKSKLENLRVGMRLALHLADGQAAVRRLEGKSPTPDLVLKSVDRERRRITLKVKKGKTLLTDLVLAKDASVFLDGAKAALTDLRPGMAISLSLAGEGDRIVVRSVSAVRYADD
jgi:hypothetical protein